METNLRTLGPQEARVVLSFREQNREIVHTADIIELLGSEQSARKVIRNLIKKGWLSRLVGGRYMLLPPEHGPENIGENNPLALASAVTERCYIGWWSAAAFHGFTTQKPMTVFVAVLQQMRPRVVEGNEIQFVKTAERKFFGFETYNVYGRHATISSPEKSVVDCIDRPDLAGGLTEVMRIVYAAMSTIDPEKLVATALQMKSTSLLQRLGFITDLVGKPLPEETRKRIRSRIPKSARSHLGRRERRPGDIGYVADWGVFVNAQKESLLAEVPRVRQGEEP